MKLNRVLIDISACICSIMRLVKSISALQNPDQSYALTVVALWA